jgi:phenylacetate-CoA ligase
MTEAGTLGSHCDRHTGIHLFEDQAIVEVVDERDRPVPGGRVGHKLLVTNLVTPDPGADPLRGLGHGRGVRRALPLRTALAGGPGLAQYKVVHDTDGLHVRAALRPHANPTETLRLVRDRLVDNLAAQGVAHPAVQVELRDHLQDERDTAGKFKLVESRLPRPAAPVAQSPGR